jgi:hypothetical protein
MPSSQPLTIVIRIPDAALSRSDLNASLGLQVDRYEPLSGGRMLRLTLQITEINGPLLSTVSNQFAPSFRGWFPEVRLDAELGCSYGLSPFVVAAAAGQALTDYCCNSCEIASLPSVALGSPERPREMRSTVGPVEGAIDTLNEGLSVERLREKADGPARDRSLLDSRIWKSGNKDDRRSTMCGRQSALQLETADARHLNITNDAGRFAEFRRLQKLLSGRKTPGSESERPNEVCRRDANGFIVIDNRNERCFCHCWVVLEHWWCLHKTGDSTRPELPQSKALAYQDLLSVPRSRSHQTNSLAPRTGGCGSIGFAVWGARLQKIILRKRPRDLTFVHCSTNHTGSQSG